MHFALLWLQAYGSQGVECADVDRYDAFGFMCLNAGPMEIGTIRMYGRCG